MQARDPSSLASASGERPGSRPSATALARTWVVWWVLCAALWMLLDDTTATPELADGAVAAGIGACGSTLVRARAPMHFVPRAAWARRWWRPWVQLVAGLPLLVRLLMRALAGGDREPGRLRSVPFAVEPDDDLRAAQVALASFAGSVSCNSVVVAIDEDRGTLLLHELVADAERSGPDPLGLGVGAR
jgi:hypothetical protein